MKTHKLILTGILFAFFSATSFAENDAPAPTATTVKTDSVYRNMEYNGFLFDIPKEARVMIDRELVAYNPDGSFGVSMTMHESPGTDQKRALNLCRGLANELKLSSPTVDNVKINGLNGAIANGSVEGKDVTVVLLPYQGKEMVAIVMADKAHKEMSDRYLRTVKKK